MKVIFDAQLPRRLARQLQSMNYDALQTLDLPRGNRTPDDEIIAVSRRDQRVAATKEADLVNSFLLRRESDKLLLISTGNIKNAGLESLFMNNIEQPLEEFLKPDFIEINQTRIIIHT